MSGGSFGVDLAASEDFTCPICVDHYRDPVTTECGHSFCRHCVCTVFGQVAVTFEPNEDLRVRCPICRCDIRRHYEVNFRLVEAMREQNLLNSEGENVYRGSAATVNNYDNNRTESEPFDLTFDGSRMDCDIIWGGGTEHNTYQETTCRVVGKVVEQEEEGSDQPVESNERRDERVVGRKLVFSAKAVYSNGPWEEWDGTLAKSESTRKYDLLDGTYVWHGWNNRRAKGKLELSFT